MDIVIVDAEFQYDRKKLTVFYYSNYRVDFRDFVKDLYFHILRAHLDGKREGEYRFVGVRCWLNKQRSKGTKIKRRRAA